MPAPPCLVFVYGTLKRGYWNHAPCLNGCEFLNTARTVGQLLHRQTLTPILDLPLAHALCRGTADPCHDTATQARMQADWSPDQASAPAAPHRFVQGELYALPHPATQLPPLDELEGFNPHHPQRSTYDRQLAPVGTPNAPLDTLAWLYPIPPHRSPSDYLPCKDPTNWRGEDELPPAYFAARQRGESPPPPPLNPSHEDQHPTSAKMPEPQPPGPTP